MKVIPLDSEDWAKSTIDQAEIVRLINEYAQEASGILKEVSPNLNIIVKPNLSHVSSTKGVGGSTYDHELMDITLSTPLLHDLQTFKRYLRETIFHEMNHAMFLRFHSREDRQLYWTVLEGLGTAFDRDYAEGEHFANGHASTEEKLAWLQLNLTTSTRSPNVPSDWIGMMYQVGTWIVDEAAKKSGKDIVELTHHSCDEVLELSCLSQS